MQVSSTTPGMSLNLFIYLLLSLGSKSYMRVLVDRGAIDQNTVQLSPGLDALLDFQHPFLFDCEMQYKLPWEEQRWGRCFTEHVCGS